ncbi:MAG: flavodoxin family protein [Deltaproteobacteria bacterium]
MRIFALNGSPRRGGNTQVLLEAVLEGVKEKGGEVEVIRLNDLTYRPCQNCGGCTKEGKCVLGDDMNPLYDKLLAADGIIVASPIYFYGVSAQTKAFLDRLQAMWSRKKILEKTGKWQDEKKRKGMFVSLAATKGPKIFDGARLEVYYGLETLGIKKLEEFLVRGIEARGEMAKKTEILEEARKAGAAFVG